MANNLLALIKQKQEAIAKLQTELDEARRLLTRGTVGRLSIMGLPTVSAVDIARPGDAKGGKRGSGRRGKKTPKALQPSIVFAPTSSAGLAVSILREAGAPLHVSDIIKRAAEDGHKIKKDTLVGQLWRYAAAKKVFYRAAPNVYALLAQK